MIGDIIYTVVHLPCYLLALPLLLSYVMLSLYPVYNSNWYRFFHRKIIFNIKVDQHNLIYSAKSLIIKHHEF